MGSCDKDKDKDKDKESSTSVNDPFERTSGDIHLHPFRSCRYAYHGGMVKWRAFRLLVVVFQVLG